MHISQQLSQQGFAFLPALKQDLDTIDIIHSIGEPVSLGGGEAIHQIRPISQNKSTPNTYSGNYGLGDFPYHTDFAHWHLPPRYFVLRCVIGDPTVKTTIIDSLPMLNSDVENVLSRAIVRSRRPTNGKFRFLRLIQYTDDGERIIRWDEKFIQPASDAGVEGFNYLKNKLMVEKHEEVCLANKGDTLIIDNWRSIHGRSSVNNPDSRRLIDRVYLKSVHQ